MRCIQISHFTKCQQCFFAFPFPGCNKLFCCLFVCVTQSVALCVSSSVSNFSALFSFIVLFSDASRKSLRHELSSLWTCLLRLLSPANMGLYGNMKNLCGVVGVVLLGLSLTQPVLSQTSCKADVAPQNFTQPHYHNTAKNNSKTGFMSAIVQSFLHTVEPNAFSSGQYHHRPLLPYFFM